MDVSEHDGTSIHQDGRPAAALGRACALVPGILDSEIPRIVALRDYFEERVSQHFGPAGVSVNGASVTRLPNTSSISLRGLEANVLLSEISDRVAASAGAACHAGVVVST